MIHRRSQPTVLSPPGLPAVLLAFALGSSAGCGSDAPPQAPDTQRVKIFLIGIGDGGRRGALLSCGDSAVPVTVMLPADEPPLDGAVRALVQLPRSVAPGLTNTLVHSRLTLASSQVEDGVAEIHLEGTLRFVPSDCQRERVRAQLESTVRQFPEVREVELFVNGEPLESILGRTPKSSAPSPESRDTTESRSPGSGS